MKNRNRRNICAISKGHRNLLGIDDYDRGTRAAKRHTGFFNAKLEEGKSFFFSFF